MLSVLIETRNDEEGLARTLGSLVPAAVEGAVREVIVCDKGSSDQTYRIAEHAGCHFVANGGIAAGIRQAKGDWLLLIEPGAKLADGWVEAAVEHMTTSTTAARFSRSRGAGRTFLSRFFRRGRPLAHGLVITKRQAASLASKGRDSGSLARGLSVKRLEGEISVAPPKQAE
jgi:glycosyltransferase involved in cell wall biosynthesis